jgi:hypothetical protein
MSSGYERYRNRASNNPEFFGDYPTSEEKFEYYSSNGLAAPHSSKRDGLTSCHVIVTSDNLRFVDPAHRSHFLSNSVTNHHDSAHGTAGTGSEKIIGRLSQLVYLEQEDEDD